jgi:hypothetical protein
LEISEEGSRKFLRIYNNIYLKLASISEDNVILKEVINLSAMFDLNFSISNEFAKAYIDP